MAIVAFSSARSGSQEDLHPFERLAITLSARFSAVDTNDAEDMVARALEEVGITFGVDDCMFVDCTDRATAKILRAWAAAPYAPCSDDDLANMPWLVQRIRRNIVVATTPATDFPHTAIKDREHAERTGMAARLAVPVVLGPGVVYALIVGCRHRHMDWSAPLVGRLRLVAEIVGGGVDRLRQDAARQPRPSDGDRFGDAARADTVYLREEARNQAETDQIIGESGSLRVALERLGQVAPLRATVLLLGETGTGKELFARALHDRSQRRDRALVRVNCAALPGSLIESELFGHEKGAFTGAISMRHGRFEMADGGTIFLDEIGDLAPELQAKLLRVLQEGEFERVGSSKTRQVDVRVIAATHIDIEKAVAEGRFRADLYYRLSVFPITLPPLRDRQADIPQLAWFFIHRHQRTLRCKITTVPPDVMYALQQHNWPGNVRELENVIERAMIRSSGGVLQLDEALHAEAVALPLSGSGETLDAVQRCHIERVLRECGGRINGVGNAAVRLGIHPNTLRFRMKKLGVIVPSRRPAVAGRPSAAHPR